MSDCLTHTTDLAVPTLMDGDAEQIGGYRAHLGGSREAIFQLYALAETAQRPVARRTFHLCQVFLLHPEAGVGEPMGELPVVGQQQQAFGFVVEATNRKYTRIIW